MQDINYGALSSAGMCIINCAPPEINVVVMAKALFDCNLTSQSMLHHNQQRDSCKINGAFQQQMAPNRTDIKFNKFFLIVVCFPKIRNNPSVYNKPLMGFGSFTVAKYGTGCPGRSIVVPYSFSVVPCSCSRHHVPDVAAVKTQIP